MSKLDKKLIFNIIQFGKAIYSVECEWSRCGALIKRVGYQNVVRVMVKMNRKLKFETGDQFLNYIQKVATEEAIKNLERGDDAEST